MCNVHKVVSNDSINGHRNSIADHRPRISCPQANAGMRIAEPLEPWEMESRNTPTNNLMTKTVQSTGLEKHYCVVRLRAFVRLSIYYSRHVFHRSFFLLLVALHVGDDRFEMVIHWHSNAIAISLLSLLRSQFEQRYMAVYIGGSFVSKTDCREAEGKITALLIVKNISENIYL